MTKVILLLATTTLICVCTRMAGLTKKILMIAAALGVLLFSSPSFAECNAICRQKCEATAVAAGSTVALCIKKWSHINAKYGAQARQFQGPNGRWNRSLCERQCRIGYKEARFSSVEVCLRGMSCSGYPDE